MHGRDEQLTITIANEMIRSPIRRLWRHTSPVPLPVVLGHEGAGVVEELGAGVDDLELGDHVVMSITPGCGMCFQCQSGSFGLCERAAGRWTGGVLANGAIRLSKGAEQLHSRGRREDRHGWRPARRHGDRLVCRADGLCRRG
jgi:Zn-dependent alcohol dehydrogenase